MRFITEEDLRQRFRRERFTEYEPEAGTRLTPGARQFLSDRGIRLTETENGVRPGNGQTGFGKKEAGSSLKQNEQPKETEAEERSQGAHPAEELPCWQLELGNLQADFLQAGLDLQREDVLVSKEIFGTGTESCQACVRGRDGRRRKALGNALSGLYGNRS